MDRQLIFLAVAILLVTVGPATMVDAALTPDEIENRLAPHLGAVAIGPPAYILPDANCTAHGDVNYETLDGFKFGFPTPVGDLGVMVLSWVGNDWWVVTEQELFGGATHTRIKEVYVKCSNEYFLAELGHTVVLSYWDVGLGVWSQIGGMAGPFGGVLLGFNIKRGFTIDCPAVPMVVDVYLHTVKILMGGKNCWFANRVRGICGNYDSILGNDWNMVGVPPLWGPFTVP